MNKRISKKLSSLMLSLLVFVMYSCEEEKDFMEINKKNSSISNIKQSEFSYSLNGEKVYMLEFGNHQYKKSHL